jgi:hypothetical protein
LVDVDTPSLDLRAPPVLEASEQLLLVPAGSAAVEALADSVVIEEVSAEVVVDLEVTEEASVGAVVVVSALLEAEVSEVAVVVSVTSPMALPPTVLHRDRVEVDETRAEAASEEEEKEEAEAAIQMNAVASAIEDPARAAQTTSLSAAETDTANAMVGMAGTTVTHESVRMRATVTTIRDSDGGTERLTAHVCSYGFVKGYLPFIRLALFVTKGKQSSATQRIGCYDLQLC